MSIVSNKVCLDFVDQYDMIILGDGESDDEIRLPRRAYEKLKRLIGNADIQSCMFNVKIEIVEGDIDDKISAGIFHPEDRRYNCVLSADQPNDKG